MLHYQILLYFDDYCQESHYWLHRHHQDACVIFRNHMITRENVVAVVRDN